MKAYFITTIFYLQIIISTGQPIDNVTLRIPPVSDEELRNSTSSNDTVGDAIIIQPTESIKNIASEREQTIDYPVVTKIEANYPEEAKKQIEKLTIEELKIKCQHISKLFQVNKTSLPNKPSYNHKPYNAQARPVYIPSKTTFKPNYFTTQKPNGFYITQSTFTQKPLVNSQSPPIKYIRLEPIILQKTILSDGRIVYYWHRSLPTAVEIASGKTQNNQISNTVDQESLSHNNYYGQPPISTSLNNIPYPYNMPYGYAPWSQHAYAPSVYNPEYKKIYTSTEDNLEEQRLTETTTESVTSTTEQSSYGYGFGSFLPFYGYNRESTTTTAEPTTTTGTTPKPVTKKLRTDDLLYAQQLKFIIPVPYDDLNGGTSMSPRNPWEFDQYAYYPKELQPNTVNLQVPYNPTFHVIRAIAVPSAINKKIDEINS